MGKKSKPSVKPIYMTGKKDIKVSVHDVIAILEMIETQGNTAKLIKASKDKDLTISVGADTVNSIKDFVVKHDMHRTKLGMQVVQPAACNDYECRFKK